MEEEQVVEEKEMGEELEASPEESGQVAEESPDSGQEVGFNSAQLHQLSSMTGRLIKKQIEESVLPHLQQNVQRPQQGNPDKLNEKYSEQLFSGDIVGTISEIMEMKERARNNLSQQHEGEVKKAITAYSEDPLYKEVAADAEKIAQELVSQHYPPGPAAETAFLRARNAYVNSLLENKEMGGLDLLRGGKRKPTKKTPKIPDRFLQQAKKDIEAGVFQDLNDWLNHFDPKTREAYGF